MVPSVSYRTAGDTQVMGTIAQPQVKSTPGKMAITTGANIAIMNMVATP
ncbi:MAG: hypothetical protein IIC60_13040 [Proteobacteria bacterium]|nr:hypothetical protein [Pseudomonadota bacterium]